MNIPKFRDVVVEFYLQHGSFETQINNYLKKHDKVLVKTITIYNQQNLAPVNNPVYDQVALVVFFNNIVEED